ncbi:radical SAM protein [Limisalsivibrio acetivorans]|uniref:radical SAM protein n=1 Tax=Limisalsivibrio acetivorans TaxID=1304888 RepID=UPI0003B5433D|nr:radical SAM protein [Limisalsivibrio acetivorans]
MITGITRENLNSITDEELKKDAERYVYIYEDFMDFVSESGMDESRDNDNTEELIKRLRDKGAGVRNSGTSVHHGEISPACIDCRTGKGSRTIFYSLLCNRDCFFCANMNQEHYDHFIKHRNDAVAELDSYGKAEKLSSIGLTGGEPLLLPEQTIAFFEHSKKNYPDAHRRLYTNGDLLDASTVEKLKNAGLDEIRISIKMDEEGYDTSVLEKLELASGEIPSVMVEMPVIPGTFEQMKGLLDKMEEIGCTGINLLEFLYPWVNEEIYKERGYRIKNRPYRVLYSYQYAGGLPIAGSEEECLMLVEYAMDKKLSLNVHYCSLENKLSAQVYTQNSGIRLMPFEYRSENDFFIKTARVYGKNTDRALEIFNKTDFNDYEVSPDKRFIEFHPRAAGLLDDGTEIGLTYNVVEEGEQGKYMREVKIDLIKPETFIFKTDA